ncbi:MAG: gamma-glutamyltransferase, partial [Longimicrobiales bacterium]
RVGMADNRANDDPRWEPVPARGIVSEGFAAERAALVGAGTAADRIEPADATSFDASPAPAACVAYDPYRGEPAAGAGHGGAARGAPPGDRPAHDRGETTHMSVVDADGNAVALTQTNSSLFGSGARVAGFFLNDSGFRFDGEATATGSSAWRTRTSTIAPTIVLEDGRVRLVTGAPGGGRIPTAIVQTMVYTLDYGMDPLAALRMARMFPSPNNRRVQLENGFSADVLHDVRAMGYQPAALSFGYARLYSIVRAGDHWIAVADPRHDGEPRGW